MKFSQSTRVDFPLPVSMIPLVSLFSWSLFIRIAEEERYLDERRILPIFPFNLAGDFPIRIAFSFVLRRYARKP